MSDSHASPGMLVNAKPLGPVLTATKSETLIKTDRVMVKRMVLLEGKELSRHKAPGEIIVQCLEGQIAFSALGNTTELNPGELLYLNANEPHSVSASVDSSFLLTLLLPTKTY